MPLSAVTEASILRLSAWQRPVELTTNMSAIESLSGVGRSGPVEAGAAYRRPLRIGAPRVEPQLAVWALRRETPAAACSLASIRAAQALETGPEPPSDGAESSSSTSDELWSPSSGDPPCEPGAFMAPFLSIISEQNHAQPSILCLYFAICQVRCPCRHSDSRNSPRAPATPSQVLSTRIEPAYPLQLSASRLMLELTE